MRVKTASHLHSQPSRSSCQVVVLVDSKQILEQVDRVPNGLCHSSFDRDSSNSRSIYANNIHADSAQLGAHQKGATTGLLVLFVVTVLVTIVVGLLFGYKLGHQHGYHSLEAETRQTLDNSTQALEELESLRLKNKVLSNKAATAKQELAISLTTLDDLRQNQQALDIENKQVSQLNELYAQTISEQGGMPLQVLGAKIEPLPENAFEYGFDVAMLSQDGQAKSMTATLTLLDDDNLVEVPLEPARYSINGIERIRGRFVMPEGFKPLQMKLVLESGNEQVEQLYDWELGDMVDSMPLSLLDLPEVDQSPITGDTLTNTKKDNS